MEIIIEVNDHRNSEKVKAYSEEKLRKQFGKYHFLTRCKLRLSHEIQVKAYDAKLELHVKMGSPIFAHEEGITEHKVLEDVIKKAKRQIEKFKEKTYHSSHKNTRERE